MQIGKKMHSIIYIEVSMAIAWNGHFKDYTAQKDQLSKVL